MARAAQVRNNPPFRVAVQMTQAGGLAQCVITSPPTVTSAMLSDFVRVPAGVAPGAV